MKAPIRSLFLSLLCALAPAAFAQADDPDVAACIADGARLAEHLKAAYEAPGGKERYWETVPCQAYRGQYKIEIIPCFDEDIVEIDTFRELKALDKTYDV